MKAMLLLTVLALTQGRLLFSQDLQAVTQKQPVPPSVQMFTGFLTGMALDSSFDSLIPCLIDFEALAKEFGHAALEIEKKSLHSILVGLKLMEHALKDIPRTLRECADDLNSDYSRLHQSLEVLRNPISINYVEGEVFEINGKNIIHELTYIVKNYNQNQWHDVGFHFGAIMGKICGSGIIIESLDN